MEQYEANCNDILSLITHDLKSPLTAVLGSLELLDFDDLSKQERKDSIKTAKKASKSVLKLIENILVMAKHEAGRMSIDTEQVKNIKEVFDEVYDTFKYQTKIKDIKFKMKIEENLPILFWDIDKIHYHVINNIISNAIKFTPNNGEISVVVKQREEFIDIKIKDNGVGISKENKKTVFEKYKTHNNQKLFKGKGLGLYNAYSFVKQHQGDIQIIDGIEKKGIGFLITLPISSENM